jgi:hypothetical protein
MISRNMRNRDDKLVQILPAMQNRVQWRDLIFKVMIKQEMTEQIMGSKMQYFLLAQSNRITSGRL